MKTCTVCGIDKAVDEYNAKPRGRFGVGARCKLCMAQYQRDRRKANPELARELDRLRNSTAAYRRYQAEYATKNRDRKCEYYRARRAKLKQQKQQRPTPNHRRCRMTQTLTDSQREMLDAIRKFWIGHSYSPTFRDLMRELRFASPNGVKSVLRTLVRKGFVTIQPYITRSIVIVGESYSDLLRSSSLLGDKRDATDHHAPARRTSRTVSNPEPRRR